MQPFELPDFYVPWPARLNPNLEAARTHSKTWAREMGILGAPKEDDNPEIWDEDGFDAHDYALFCAYIHPEAPSPELNLMTDWNVWAFYVDDYFLQVYKRPKDHDGGKQYLDRILLFMPVDGNSLPTPTNPMECALADLWLRTAPTKSEAWRSRLIEDTRSLLEAFIWELDSVSQQRLANPIEYIEMRRQVGAALWSADLVEHAMFIEIPDRIASIRPMKVLKDTFADGVHLRNDIFSYQREVLKEGELTNAVLVVERFLDVETQQAVNLVNDLLTARLQQFEHTVFTELMPMFQEYDLDPIEQANVLTYIRGLQDWQSGAHEWHFQTSRYLNPRVRHTAGGFIPNLSGFDRSTRQNKLGTAAMRITSNSLGLNRFKNYMHAPYRKVGPTQLPKFYMPFEVTVSPHLEIARQHEKDWAHRMRMMEALPGDPHIFIWDERKFEGFDLALFSAMAHPTAPDTQLNFAACWVTWATFTDDYFVAVYGRTQDVMGAKVCHARLLEFMPVDDISFIPVPLTPVEHGLADLWTYSAAMLSVDERHLFRTIVDGMIGSWVWEITNQAQNRIPDVIDYIQMRRKTSGSGLMIEVPRTVFGGSIPPEIHQTLTMQQMNNAAVDYACLANDIFSYQKEIEFDGEIHNGVLVIQNFMGCSQIQAIKIVNNLMTARMKQFEHIEITDLPLLFENFDLSADEREQVLVHVKALKNFMGATLKWHFKTNRYTDSAVSKPFFTGNPTRLGTMAVHILDMISRQDKLFTSSPLQKEAPKEMKFVAISHLALPFLKKKEEAQQTD